MTPQNQGYQFEKDLANEFGLKRVSGSGSVWFSKLDLTGHGIRWSLKYTSKNQFPINFADIVEAIQACYDIGGDGAIPIWAARIEPLGEDFILMQAGYSKLMKIIEEDKPQVAARKRRASQPELLREEE